MIYPTLWTKRYFGRVKRGSSSSFSESESSFGGGVDTDSGGGGGSSDTGSTGGGRGRTFTADYETFFGEFGGDKTRYGFHPYLTSKSLVIEVGGYTGVDILAMHKLYGAFRTFLFEPVFFKEAKNNLNEVPNIRLFPYGLGNSSRMVHFDVMGDGTKPAQQGTGQQLEIADFRELLQKLRINHVDLLQINCEGCEWEVLETVIGSREVANTFGRIQVQFHPGAEWVDDKLERYAVIQDELTQTHSLVYDQPWIWQMWQRNDLISL